MAENLERVTNHARKVGLVISGVCPLMPQDGFDSSIKSIALLSPDPSLFWAKYSLSEQANDGKPDPIDRWSRNTILQMAHETNGVAVFPFEGPPYYPFSTWAQRAGVAWQSPSGLLVHKDYGLWISFRGAIALKFSLETPSKSESPCAQCPRPCLEACPVNALSDGAFEYQACLEHVRSPDGSDCADFGCLARRACPIGQDYAPPPEQIRAHMSAFMG